MFARLTSARINKERVDEFIAIYEKSVVPAAKSQQGYQGAYLLVDRAEAKGISITLWKSEKDALANERNRYYQEQVTKFITFYTGPPVREGFEVCVQD
ncbi:MAG: antibiotic biosynthesis monooxygenase family protein [Candidatus Aminicenantes bacterium]